MQQLTKEQIIEASKTSKEAKECLEKLFPELFPKDLLVMVNEDYTYKTKGRTIDLLRLKTLDEYAFKGFYLNDDFNWEIKRDSKNVLCLIPTRKS